MSTQASTLWQDGGTHIEGPLSIGGIPLAFPNSTQVYLRGDGQFKPLAGLAGNSTVNSTVVIGGVTFIISNGLITSIT